MVQPGVERTEEQRELLEKSIIELLHRERHLKVRDIVGRLQNVDKGLGFEDIRDAIDGLIQKDMIVLKHKPTPVQSFPVYLTHYMSFPFWFAVGVVAITLFTTYFVSSAAPWFVIRMIASGVFLLLMPGYAIVEILFPRKDISYIERLALSTGLSIALLPLIGLILGYSVFGISLDSIVITISMLCIPLFAFSVYRKFRLIRNPL